MSSYEAECPFCGHLIEMGKSEYPYTSGGCGNCSARLQFSNYRRKVIAIQGLPRTDWEWRTRPKKDGEFGASRFDGREAVFDELVADATDFPSEYFIVREPKVGHDRVKEVLDAGVNDPDVSYGVSTDHFTKRELREIGVDI